MLTYAAPVKRQVVKNGRSAAEDGRARDIKAPAVPKRRVLGAKSVDG